MTEREAQRGCGSRQDHVPEKRIYSFQCVLSEGSKGFYASRNELFLAPGYHDPEVVATEVGLCILQLTDKAGKSYLKIVNF